MNIDTILYDFGGVLIGWDPYLAYEGHLDRDQVEEFFTDVDFPALNTGRDAGATWAAARTAIETSHPHHAAHLDLYVHNFPATLTGPIAGSEDLVHELAHLGLHLYGLTNWSAELFHHAAPAAPAITAMEDTLVSGHAGLAKPDPAIFHAAIDRFGLDPARTLFIDDSATNTATAHTLGFHTHTFTDTLTLRAALADLGIDVAPA